ncbi:MAG: hypothetical protein AAFY56_09380 [Pseudomonadota bacterium]
MKARTSRLPFVAVAPPFFGILLLLALSACGPREPAPPAPYSSNAGPIQFSVAQIEYTNPSTISDNLTFIDRRRSEELGAQTLTLLEQRLQAGGGEGLARVEVLEASVIEGIRPTQGGFRGFFTREASGEIDSNISVRVTLVDGFGLEQGFAEAKVGRTRPILEGTSALGREADAQIVIYNILGQLDAALDETVAANLQPFVILF